MGLVTGVPNLPTKSFWDRPEGRTGKIFVLAALAGAGGITWFYVLPFLITIVSNTLYLAGLVTVLAAFLYVVFNGTFQTLVKFAFKSAMRKLTSLFIEIDPIGILKNYIVEMQRNLAAMDEQISKLNGAISGLENNIKANAKESADNIRLAEQAKREISKPGVLPEDTQRFTYKMTSCMSHSGRLDQTNVELTQLRDRLKKVYDTLIRIRATAEYYIEDKTYRVKEETSRRKALASAFSAYHSAMSILKGNPDQNDLYDSTLEYLADDAGEKLGQMADFSRVAEEFVSTMDLQNGAFQQEALQKLEQYEKKMLPAATAETVPVFTKSQGELVPAKSKAAGDYKDLLT